MVQVDVAVPDGDEGRRGDSRMSASVQPAKPGSKLPSFVQQVLQPIGMRGFGQYSCSIRVPAIMSTVIAPTASLFSERSPSGWNDADDTISLRTSSGCLIAK